MSSKKWFDILGIPPTQDEAVIKRAYRQKALLYHPDRNPSKEAKAQFIEVSKAYEQLMIFIKNPEKVRAATHQRARSHRTHTNHTNNQQTSFERRRQAAEERMRWARQHYEETKRKEEEVQRRTHQQMKTGKKWKIYKSITLVAAILGILLLVDYLILPTKVVAAKMTHTNDRISYAAVGDNIEIFNYIYYSADPTRLIDKQGVSPTIYNEKFKIWTPHVLVTSRSSNNFYLEKTMIFKDIKSVSFWENSKRFTFIPDYSIAVTFPMVPIILLMPLLTVYFEKKNFIFYYFFYHSIYYFMPAIIAIVLISNNRWLFWAGF